MFNVWTLVIAVGGFVVGIAGAAVAVLFLPEDYFLPPGDRGEPAGPQHPVRRIVKNVVGVILVILGVAMLVMPGQGLLTIVIGLMLVDFPGKHALVERLIARPKMFSAANAWRARWGKSPLKRSRGVGE